MNAQRLIHTYVRLRDRKKELEERHAEELKPLRDGMERIESMLMGVLQDQKMDAVRTSAGTAYRASWTSVKVEDWDATLRFILRTEYYDLFERRVNATVAQALGEVPGVRLERGVRLHVRRA